MREYVKLTPLNQEERLYAEENYPVLERYIKLTRLDQNLHDVAYLGYLHAVKSWYARPDLHRWSFQTIMKQSIRSHLSNEKRAAGRRIQTVSLEAIVPGTDGLCYMDTITEGNIRFLKEETVETKKIQYDVKIPGIARSAGSRPRCSVELEMLMNFLASKHKTMSIEYADAKEAKTGADRLRDYKRKHKREDFNIFKFEETLYVEKVAPNRA